MFIVQAVGENLPFKDGSIPQIFANDTLHHVQFQNETLENCYHAMSPNGNMMIREFDPEYWKTKFLIFLEWVLLFGSTFLSPRRLEEICQKIGFSVDWQRLSKSTYLLNARKQG